MQQRCIRIPFLLFQEGNGSVDQSGSSGGRKELVGPGHGLKIEFIRDGLYRDDVGWLGAGRGLKLGSLWIYLQQPGAW